MITPPQIIISLPSPHCRVTFSCGGRVLVLVPIQLSVMGLYLPPCFTSS